MVCLTGFVLRKEVEMTSKSKRLVTMALLLPISLIACVGVAVGDPGYRQVVTLPTEHLTVPDFSATSSQSSSSATTQGTDQTQATPITAPVNSSTPLAISISPAALLNMDINALGSSDAASIALVGKLAAEIEIAKTHDGAQQVAQVLAKADYGWTGSQFACLSSLWENESHWNFHAINRYSGALGIAQANPPSKMDVTATDWLNNPITQIKWGLNYIKVRYGTPCHALSGHRWRGYY
jgi:hypothetical protein